MLIDARNGVLEQSHRHAFIAAVTKRIKLGTSIVHVDGRTPATTAMTAK